MDLCKAVYSEDRIWQDIYPTGTSRLLFRFGCFASPRNRHFFAAFCTASMSKFVTTVEYGGAHNLAADITANVTTGQSRQFFKQILCRAVNKGPIGSFCWRSIFSSTSFWNGKITMKLLILSSRKISQICVWAWTENTNYRYLSTLKYGGFTNFIILVTSLTLDFHMWISLVFV